MVTLKYFYDVILRTLAKNYDVILDLYLAYMMSEVLKKRYRVRIKKNEDLLKIFHSSPISGLRQLKNMRRLLCSAKLQQGKRSARLMRNLHLDAPGWKRCGVPCPICRWKTAPR